MRNGSKVQREISFCSMLQETAIRQEEPGPPRQARHRMREARGLPSRLRLREALPLRGLQLQVIDDISNRIRVNARITRIICAYRIEVSRDRIRFWTTRYQGDSSPSEKRDLEDRLWERSCWLLRSSWTKRCSSLLVIFNCASIPANLSRGTHAMVHGDYSRFGSLVDLVRFSARAYVSGVLECTRMRDPPRDCITDNLIACRDL